MEEEFDVLDYVQLDEAFKAQEYSIIYHGKRLVFNNKKIASINSDITFEQQYWSSTDFYIFVCGLVDEYEENLSKQKAKYESLYDYMSLYLFRFSKGDILMYSGNNVFSDDIKKKYDVTVPTESIVKKAIFQIQKDSYPARIGLEPGEDLKILRDKIQTLENDLRKLKTTKQLCELKDNKLRSLNSNERLRLA